MLIPSKTTWWCVSWFLSLSILIQLNSNFVLRDCYIHWQGHVLGPFHVCCIYFREVIDSFQTLQLHRWFSSKAVWVRLVSQALEKNRWAKTLERLADVTLGTRENIKMSGGQVCGRCGNSCGITSKVDWAWGSSICAARELEPFFLLFPLARKDWGGGGGNNLFPYLLWFFGWLVFEGEISFRACTHRYHS